MNSIGRLAPRSAFFGISSRIEIGSGFLAGISVKILSFAHHKPDLDINVVSRISEKQTPRIKCQAHSDCLLRAKTEKNRWSAVGMREGATCPPPFHI